MLMQPLPIEWELFWQGAGGCKVREAKPPTGRPCGPRLTARQKLAASAVAAHPDSPMQAIAAALDLTPRSARSLQRVLERKGAI